MRIKKNACKTLNVEGENQKSRRNFLSVALKGVSILMGFQVLAPLEFFIGGKTSFIEEIQAQGACGNLMDCAGSGGKCGSAMDCAGGGGKCGSSMNCAGGGKTSTGSGACGTAMDCAGSGGKCGTAMDCAGGGGKCGTSFSCGGN
jgi:hypothetical protein